MSLASNATSVPVVTAPLRSVIAEAYASSSTAAIAAVDDDAYASAITDLRGAVTTGTEVAFEARNINTMGQKVWQDAGQSSDPGGYYYVALTFDAAGDTAGDLSFVIEYTVD